MTETDALDILQVAPDASPEEIRRAYLDLVKVWHPDRFQSDARLRDKAQRRLQEINRAYALLEHGATASRTVPSGSTEPAAPPGTGDTLWLQLHRHTAIAAGAGLALGVALALALIFRPTSAPAAGPATGPSVPVVPMEEPLRPVVPAAAPRPRPAPEPARPDSGTDIGRRGPVGRGVLSIRSALNLDGVVELTHDAGHTRRFYLRRGEKITLLDLQPGTYRLRVALGTNWTGQWFGRTAATLERDQPTGVAQHSAGASFETLTLSRGDAGMRPAAPFGPD